MSPCLGYLQRNFAQMALFSPSAPPGPLNVSFRQTQAVCYIGLWYVGGNRYDSDGEVSSGTDPNYSIFAIAISMYLLLSIAAADLCGGWALALEGRGSDDFVWFTRRRIFGFCLFGTFFLLVGASIRVLFYSSIENVELILGAAAVLFVADVVSVWRGVCPSASSENVQGEYTKT